MELGTSHEVQGLHFLAAFHFLGRRSCQNKSHRRAGGAADPRCFGGGRGGRRPRGVAERRGAENAAACAHVAVSGLSRHHPLYPLVN